MKTAVNQCTGTLVVVLSLYAVAWIWGNREMLFDPMLQNNDVRAHVYAFHRYAREGAMKEDPVNAEILNMMTPGVHALYRLVVPFTTVPVAAKIVQGVCFALLVLAVGILARAHRFGLAAAALLGFFIFHTAPLIGKMVGGFQRSFAIPCITLWVAGALVGRAGPGRAMRVAGIAIGALTYPVAMALLLAAELFFVASEIRWQASGWREDMLSQGARYAVLVVACIVLLTPYMISKREAGPIHSLKEAREESVFGQNGRVKALPFPSPAHAIKSNLVRAVQPAGRAVVTQIDITDVFEDKRLELTVALGLALAIAFCIYKSLVPFPRVAICILAAALVMYCIARLVAFQLYVPHRYLLYGLPFALIAGIAELLPGIRMLKSQRARHGVAAVAIVGSIALLGDGIESRLGVNLDGREHARLYEYFRKLPGDVLIAAHPGNGDDIPFWAGRSTTGGYETILPWFVDSWRRQKAHTEQVLRVLYSTSHEHVVSFCRDLGVTHFLLDANRYGPQFRVRARMFEPFGHFIDRLLSGVERNDLVLGHAIESHVVFREGSLVVVECKTLRSG